MNKDKFKDRLSNVHDYPVTIGCDPEIFIFDGKRDMYVGAHEYIKGTKDQPFPLEGGSCQVDGLAVEIGITPAVSTVQFSYRIKEVLRQVESMLPKHCKLHYKSTAWFDKAYFDNDVPDYCKVLGCEPDYDVYNNGRANPRPNGNIIQDGKIMRTAGGHIHIGFTKDADVYSDKHLWDCMILTKNMDRAFMPLLQYLDDDTNRQKMYGKPGSFRPKTYGVEYRPLSNFWVGSETGRSFIYNMTKHVFNLTYCGFDFKYSDTSKEYTHKHIDHYYTSDIKNPSCYLRDRFFYACPTLPVLFKPSFEVLGSKKTGEVPCFTDS